MELSRAWACGRMREPRQEATTHLAKDYPLTTHPPLTRVDSPYRSQTTYLSMSTYHLPITKSPTLTPANSSCFRHCPL